MLPTIAHWNLIKQKHHQFPDRKHCPHDNKIPEGEPLAKQKSNCLFRNQLRTYPIRETNKRARLQLDTDCWERERRQASGERTMRRCLLIELALLTTSNTGWNSDNERASGAIKIKYSKRPYYLDSHIWCCGKNNNRQTFLLTNKTRYLLLFSFFLFRRRPQCERPHRWGAVKYLN